MVLIGSKSVMADIARFHETSPNIGNSSDLRCIWLPMLNNWNRIQKIDCKARRCTRDWYTHRQYSWPISYLYKRNGFAKTDIVEGYKAKSEDVYISPRDSLHWSSQNECSLSLSVPSLTSAILYMKDERMFFKIQPSHSPGLWSL